MTASTSVRLYPRARALAAAFLLLALVAAPPLARADCEFEGFCGGGDICFLDISQCMLWDCSLVSQTMWYPSIESLIVAYSDVIMTDDGHIDAWASTLDISNSSGFDDAWVNTTLVLPGGSQTTGSDWEYNGFALAFASLPMGSTGGDGYVEGGHGDRKSTRLNSSHIQKSRMPSSA